MRYNQPMPRRKQSGDSKGISIRDAISYGLLLLSAGTVYGILSTRVSTLESRYDREVVPRAEHLQMNMVLEQRLESIIDNQRKADTQIQSV